MKSFFLISCSLVILSSCNKQSSYDTINLEGNWLFQIDSLDKGSVDKWFNNTLNDIILLPGSMTENGKGNEISVSTPWTGAILDDSWFRLPQYEKYRKAGNVKVPFWLQPLKYYKGASWYQRIVEIPDSWKGKPIELFLERCHWETRVWIDSIPAGMQNSLSAPHIYDLTRFITPGKHTITICVDNRIKDIDVGENAHSISDHTQTNWNGIVGKMEIRTRSPIYASNIRLFPDVKNKKVHLKVTLKNIAGTPVKAKISLMAELLQKDTPDKLQLVEEMISTNGENEEFDIEYPMGDNPELWDEFNPNVYQMNVTVSHDGEDVDNQKILFGMRDFKTRGTQFTINDRPVFLRGTLECAIFPKTGYPPTDTASWIRIFRIARSFGLNHLRFHSWCPPESAFEAADFTGFYLHVECGAWANIGDGKPVDKFLYEESERIINSYGNHPSFCIMLYGNEPSGKNTEKWLSDFVTYWKNKDPRRLYSSGAGWPILQETDFNSTADPRIQAWGQGLSSIINAQPPRSDYDWSSKISKFNKPAISHEIGQWCVYPDFKEIARYTGVLRARNFEIFKETLEENHMGSLADSFLLASGKLQALCYKADIEAALRTPDFGGFQLLDLHDFPGQGTALVGVLNPFWEEKGYITAKEFNRFCNATVPLVRLPKMIFKSGESLIAPVEIAHFGEKELINVTPTWKLVEKTGNILFQGKLPVLNIRIGNCIRLGEINQSLVSITNAEQLSLVVTVDKFENSWDIWVYPDILPEIKDKVLVTQTLDSKAIETLKRGGKVLLNLKKGSLKPEKGGNIAVGFSSIFWNTAWTNKQPPHTLGILCNPKHPALAGFPGDYYSNFQWWDAMSHCSAVILSDFPSDLKPIVRIIDDWFTNRPLGLIFEAKVGSGKLLVTGIDLQTGFDKRPEAQQLLYSLKKYMSGASFDPETELNTDKLLGMFN
jgi:hypothetical protein